MLPTRQGPWYLDSLAVVLVCPTSIVAQVANHVQDLLIPCMVKVLACPLCRQFICPHQFRAAHRDTPASRASMAASMSAFFSTRSESLHRSRPRSAAGTFMPQDVLNAARAAWTARSTSFAVAAATFVRTLPSALHGRSQDRCRACAHERPRRTRVEHAARTASAPRSFPESLSMRRTQWSHPRRGLRTGR